MSGSVSGDWGGTIIMDGAFACPECGTIVEVKGLAPGRQVRCGFCHRLLEVPYLPRVEDKRWKRRRFGRPWWVPWAWCTLGVLAAAMILIAMPQLLDRHERAALDRSIQELIASSESKERSGNLGQALVDLDTALTLCSHSPARTPVKTAELRRKRGALATREARLVLDRLSEKDTHPFPLGDWLNIQARITADADLAALKKEVTERFRGKLMRRVEIDLAAARVDLESGRAVVALELCNSLVPLFPHLLPTDQVRLRREAEQIVFRIVDRQGIFVGPPRGHFLRGSEAKYNASMMPELFKAVTAKGYVPQVNSPTWGDRWSAAPYRLTLQVNERLEGNYMSSENRLTRIDAHITLLYRGQEIWKTTPTARTMVPLPSLPAYLSARVALSPARIQEFERLLSDTARSIIDEKLYFAVSHMPGCGQVAAQSGN
jgi:hypothetical protein